jgi:hypothetical protein
MWRVGVSGDEGAWYEDGDATEAEKFGLDSG